MGWMPEKGNTVSLKNVTEVGILAIQYILPHVYLEKISENDDGGPCHLTEASGAGDTHCAPGHLSNIVVNSLIN